MPELKTSFQRGRYAQKAALSVIEKNATIIAEGSLKEAEVIIALTLHEDEPLLDAAKAESLRAIEKEVLDVKYAEDNQGYTHFIIYKEN